MKIIIANNKKSLRLSRKEWESIGNKIGWLKKSSEVINKYPPMTPQQGAELIAKMSEEERDSCESKDWPGGIEAFKFYEAKKIMPKVHGKFKRVNHNNSLEIWQYCYFVVNVNGRPILASLYDDPDYDGEDELDENGEAKEGSRKGKVLVFFRPEDKVSQIFESDWSNYKDAVDQLIAESGWF